jgi:NAD(P)-dependent dehydrogenase (short-subunit alcohol dehydrogenase family)
VLAAGGKMQSAVLDLTRPDACRTAVDAAVAAFGRLDVLCNIAGILLMEHAHETRLEDWRRVLEVNLTGTFLVSIAALPHLLESKGNIVNASSTSALAGLPYGAAYGASKGGVLALTRTLAVEYGRQGLRANAVCPGSITTPMTSRSKLPKDVDGKLLVRAMALDQPRGPETVASVIAMLASEDGAHINGEHIRVDGGTLS